MLTRHPGGSPRCGWAPAAAVVLLAAGCGAMAKVPAVPRAVARSTTTSKAPTSVTESEWTTYGGSFSRTSADDSDAAVTGTPAEAWTSPALDGGVYGEPLIFDQQVIVATENDTVYDLSATDGAVRWSDHLASPAPADLLPCGDISPTVGITSTMVIDPDTGVLFASAETDEEGAVHHEIFALRLSTHALLWSRDVDQPGWTASAQLQRIGLGLSDGHVIVGFGGNDGDCGLYHGWVVGVPETGTGSLLSYEVPTAREGAIWAPAGVTVDGAGDVFVATGNGSAVAGQPFDHGDAVIELSPGLTERQYFAPSDWAADNATDGDLGSTSPVLLDGGQLFEVGKQVTAYLLDADALGGIGGQVASLPVCFSQGGNAYRAPDVFVACNHAGQIDEVVIGPGDVMTRGWTWNSPTGGASSPTIAEGVVWVIDLDASVLYGIDPSDGSTRFSLPLDTGTPEHFAAPSAAEGMIVVAGSRSVEAFR